MNDQNRLNQHPQRLANVAADPGAPDFAGFLVIGGCQQLIFQNLSAPGTSRGTAKLKVGSKTMPL